MSHVIEAERKVTKGVEKIRKRNPRLALQRFIGSRAIRPAHVRVLEEPFGEIGIGYYPAAERIVEEDRLRLGGKIRAPIFGAMQCQQVQGEISLDQIDKP